MPSVKEMALNLLSTTKEVIKNVATKGVLTVSDTIANTRWEVCNKCDYLLKDENNSVYRCKLCGCNMKVKIKLAVSSCPINKWNKV